MYERRGTPLVARGIFLKRLAAHFGVAALLVAGSLACGMAGYWYFEKLPWLDAFLNAAMLLGGMGPVTIPTTPTGKLFAGLYALYSGMIFLVVVAIIMAPVVHRFLHRFHLADDDARGDRQ